MAKLDLRVRKLQTGETLQAMFESEQDALRYLIDRPRFEEVLGVATHGLPREVYTALRTACRALDPEEKVLSEQLDAAEHAAIASMDAEARRAEEAEAVAHREAARTADPDRPMQIEWSRENGMRVADPNDPRAITEVAREAVLAWVRERDEWVRDRGQVVDEALVTVWPGALPSDAAGARALPGGQFFPAAAPTS